MRLPLVPTAGAGGAERAGPRRRCHLPPRLNRVHGEHHAVLSDTWEKREMSRAWDPQPPHPTASRIAPPSHQISPASAPAAICARKGAPWPRSSNSTSACPAASAMTPPGPQEESPKLRAVADKHKITSPPAWLWWGARRSKERTQRVPPTRSSTRRADGQGPQDKRRICLM